MAEKRGHYVKEGRVFIQDEDGAFLELVPTADGNFDTKPAKKEDVRGADFIEGPFDPQQAAFAGQELPGETPPAPAPPGPPMPPGYTLTAEEEQEVGASSEEAQQQAEQALADEPLSDEEGANREFFKAFYPEGWPDDGLAPEDARARLEKLEIDPSTVVVFQAPLDDPDGPGQVFVMPATGLGSYAEWREEASQEDRDEMEAAVVSDWDLLTEAAPEEATEEVPEEEATEEEADEAAEDLGLVVEEQADDNPELAQEVADPKLQGMDGRQRVVHVLQNRQLYPEFNRALRSAAEQFYTDRRSGRNMALAKVFGDLPKAMAMKAQREMPQRLEQSELKEERDRLLSLQENAKKFNIELERGEYSSAASLLGSLLDTATQRRGQLEGQEQQSSNLASTQQHAVYLQDLRERSDALKNARAESNAAGAGGMYQSYDWDANDLATGRDSVAKAIQKAQQQGGLSPGELAALRIKLISDSGTPTDPYAAHAFVHRVGTLTEIDDALEAVGANSDIVMGSKDDRIGLGEQIQGIAKEELVMQLVQLYGMDEADASMLADAQQTDAMYPWSDDATAEAKARALEAEAQEETNYDRARADALTNIGSRVPDSKQKKALEETLQLLGSDDLDQTLVEVARLTTLGDSEGKGGVFEGAPLFDPDSYTADLEKVEADLAGARLSPMQRQIENLKSTEQGASAMAALTGRGLSEAEAVERLVKTVGKRSFKQDARKIGGAMRREHRGRAREGDESLLMAGPSEVAAERSMTAGRPFSLTGDTGAPLAEAEDEDSGRAPTQPVAQYEAPDLGVQETLGTKKAQPSYAEASKKERRNVIMEQMFPSTGTT